MDINIRKVGNYDKEGTFSILFNNKKLDALAIHEIRDIKYLLTEALNEINNLKI